MKNIIIMRTFIAGTLLLAAATVFSGVVLADGEVGDAKQFKNRGGRLSSDKKSVTGRVVMISGNRIDVIYKEDPETGEQWEMGFDIDETIATERKKNLEKISEGDTVKIEYEDVLETTDEKLKDGKISTQTRLIGQRAENIVFVKPKQGALVSGGKNN